MKSFIDPHGAVVALLAGIGWGPSAPEGSGAVAAGYARSRPGAKVRRSLILLAGPAANLVLAGIALLAYRLVDGPAALLRVVSVTDVVHGSVTGIAAGPTALLLLAVVSLSTGLLALAPIPPLDGGRLLFLLGGSTPRWQRAEYELSDHNWGTVIVLVLLLVPLGGQSGVLVEVVDAAARPLLALFAR